MRFHASGYDPAPRATLVCRYQRWGLLVILAVFWGAAVAWWRLEAPALVTYGVAGLAALITFPVLRTWRKRGRCDNWALAIDPSGVWLNLRDSEYHDAERGETIVHLPYREIRSVRRTIERYTLPHRKNDSTKHREDYLEIQLARPEAPQIAERIAAEQQREAPPHKSFGGMVTTRIPRTVATIRTTGDDKVLILYSSRTHRLSPRLSRILAALERYVPIEGDEQSSPESWKTLDDAQLDDRLRALVSQGRLIDAMKLARASKKLSLTEARELVNSIAEPTERCD